MSPERSVTHVSERTNGLAGFALRLRSVLEYKFGDLRTCRDHCLIEHCSIDIHRDANVCVSHQSLLCCDWCSRHIEPGTIRVPKGVSADRTNAGCLRRSDKLLPCSGV